jgi:hypothetical protein
VARLSANERGVPCRHFDAEVMLTSDSVFADAERLKVDHTYDAM